MPGLEYTIFEKQGQNGNAELEINISLNSSSFNLDRITETARDAIRANYGFRCRGFRLRPAIDSYGLDNAVVKAEVELEPLHHLLKGAKVVETRREESVKRKQFSYDQEFDGDPSVPAKLLDQEMKRIYSSRFLDSKVNNLRAVTTDGKRRVTFNYVLYLLLDDPSICWEGCGRNKK